jgi:ATP/maltotriose-dependent transcriptional regulator MalT
VLMLDDYHLITNPRLPSDTRLLPRPPTDRRPSGAVDPG